jgi:hypothetical protein
VRGRSLYVIRSGLRGLIAVGLLISGLGPAYGSTAQAAALATPSANCPAGQTTDANGNCVAIQQPTTTVQQPTTSPPAITPEQASIASQSLVNAFFGVAFYMISGVIPPEIGFALLLTYRRQANALPEPFRSITIAQMARLFN